MGMQRIDDLLAAGIERALIGLLRQADKDLVIFGLAVTLDARILDARRRGGLANLVGIRRFLELHLHLRAAAKVHAQRHGAADLRPMHAHGDDTGHAEDH